MPQGFSRTDRVNHLLQRQLALIIERDSQDATLPGFSISRVVVSRDFNYAKVYITILSDNQDKITQVIEHLTEMSTPLRRALGKSIHLRRTPHLKFFYDDTLAKRDRLQTLIDEAIEHDEQSKDKSTRGDSGS